MWLNLQSVLEKKSIKLNSSSSNCSSTNRIVTLCLSYHLYMCCLFVCNSAVVAYKGELYILSGYNGIHDLHFDDMYRFNPGQ